MTLWQRLRQYPVIPAVWDPAGLRQALRVPVAAIWLQHGSVLDLPATRAQIRAAHPDAPVLFHLELAQGLAADAHGVRFARSAGLDGIITTRPHLVEAAREAGLLAVLRAFLQDSRAVRRVTEMAARCGPDALDLLPGPAVAEVVAELRQAVDMPVLASGLIRGEDMAGRLLAAGCRGMTTSFPPLWGWHTRAQ